MKKIILLLAFCLSVGNLFAQDANADKLREEGDAAMTAKNYPEVVAKYSEYLKLTNPKSMTMPSSSTTWPFKRAIKRTTPM